MRDPPTDPATDLVPVVHIGVLMSNEPFDLFNVVMSCSLVQGGALIAHWSLDLPLRQRLLDNVGASVKCHALVLLYDIATVCIFLIWQEARILDPIPWNLELN